MRHHVTAVAMALTLSAMACSDAPTSASLRPFDAVLQHTELEDFIQAAIDRYLPKGFEAAVEARWANVRNQKLAGDMAGAVQQFNTLSLWIDKKTGDITIPAGETVTKGQAAALIILNMGRWLYEGQDADPLAVPTGDVAVEVVPAGAPLALVVPSQHASITWDAGATQETRVVIMIEDTETYPAQCQGPLMTRRCQYPLFYKVESFPHTRLQTPGRLAVCMVTTGDRRPIEYPNDEPTDHGHHGPVGERLRLAHNLPENEADRHPNGIAEDGIEILPLSETQSGLVDCDAPSTLGMGPMEKALHLAMKFAGKVISPKSAYAYDQGPEHEFSFFSNFNAVDPFSAPDVTVTGLTAPTAASGGETVSISYRVVNRSRRADGGATATSPGGMTTLYISSDAVLDAEDEPIEESGQLFGALAPGDSTGVVTQQVTLPQTAGSWYVIVGVEQGEGALPECEPSGDIEFPTCYTSNNAVAALVDVADGFVGIWNGLLAPPGSPEGAGQPVTVIVTGIGEESCVGEFRVAQVAGGTAYNSTRAFTSCTVSGAELLAVIDPWVNPFNNANRSEFALVRDGNSILGTATRFFPPAEGEEEGTQDNPPWVLTLSRGTTATVGLPPVINLRASVSAGPTANNWF